MLIVKIILLVIAVVILLPTLSYMIGKFAAAGYFRAKQRQETKTKNQNK